MWWTFRVSLLGVECTDTFPSSCDQRSTTMYSIAEIVVYVSFHDKLFDIIEALTPFSFAVISKQCENFRQVFLPKDNFLML